MQGCRLTRMLPACAVEVKAGADECTADGTLGSRAWNHVLGGGQALTPTEGCQEGRSSLHLLPAGTFHSGFFPLSPLLSLLTYAFIFSNFLCLFAGHGDDSMFQ